MKAADMSDAIEKIRFPVYVSRKYDGVRVIFYQGKAFSASGRLHRNPWLQNVAHTYKGALHCYEGELWHPSLEAAVVAGWLNRKESHGPIQDGLLKPGSLPLAVITFGMYQNAFKHTGISITDAKLYVNSVTHTRVTDIEMLQRYIQSAKDLDYEGLMLRGGDLLYKHGRATSVEQLLMKIVFDSEALARCIGWEPVNRNTNAQESTLYGTQERSSSKAGKQADTSEVGTFLWEMLEGPYKGVCFNARGSFSQEQMRRYAIEPPIGRVAEIRYKKVGGKDKPRQPRFKRWQGDE